MMATLRIESRCRIFPSYHAARGAPTRSRPAPWSRGAPRPRRGLATRGITYNGGILRRPGGLSMTRMLALAVALAFLLGHPAWAADAKKGPKKVKKTTA